MAASYGEGLGGGVVLGADTRTSSGNYIANRATDKITQLTDKVNFSVKYIKVGHVVFSAQCGSAIHVYRSKTCLMMHLNLTNLRQILSCNALIVANHAADIHVPLRLCS